MLDTILIYARDPRKSAEFYQRIFGLVLSASQVPGLITLESPDGGARLVFHQAAKSVKLGQVGVKLVFYVPDVDAFKRRTASLGLEFGATHVGEDYSFANAKDPDKNNVCISSRPPIAPRGSTESQSLV